MPSRRELANAIRALAMDAVQQANSGHPGMPMGMADIAEVLWNDHLKHNPANPKWADRDRFVLSNGHGSMLLYAVLHLTGYDLPLAELKRFRQLHSRTPGHPEYGLTPGVETTTGPLGQGLANAVGMAIAEKSLAARFNRPGFKIVDHYTYVFVGDGCLMEGISHEVCSLAGTLGLGKLIVFYDDNGISIDGRVQGWFTDDTPKRFASYGWHVVTDVDGLDAAAVKRAIEEARAVTDKPTLIDCKTIIGFGAPHKQNTQHAHGEALGEAEVIAARQELGWKYPAFEIPPDYYAGWDARPRGAAFEGNWNNLLAEYAKSYPQLAAEFTRRQQGELPDGWPEASLRFINETAGRGSDVASRKASQNSLDAYGPLLPELIGGSADLTGSNNTLWKGSRTISRQDFGGNYLHFGVREFGMTAILNGLVLHGGFIPYGGTFLTFSDYARNAIRMAALMGAGCILIYTHDSIGLGEDGPTHQAVEQLTALRIIPGMELWRPCDDVETAVAWAAAIERRRGPTALALSRQSLPHVSRTPLQVESIRRGGYILRDCQGTPAAIIIATGSELGLAIEAAAQLAQRGLAVRVVSMPCSSVFDAQEQAYREHILPVAVQARVAVEAGVTEFWHRYVGPHGRIVGIDRFGESAPAKQVFEYFGFSVDNVMKQVEMAVASVKSHGTRPKAPG
ncbi:MAG: transketolase [Gammaproteobacteria bacterium]|nr:transketolase [Gammaproteobacteria bacterium]MDE2345405.1 transketolase [Gammaproteobacteria bacterium]